MKIGYAVLMGVVSMSTLAAEKNVEEGRVLPQSGTLQAIAREATSVRAGQVLKAPNGCIYAVKFQNGVLSLTPANDEHGQPLCVPQS
jgi:hypothetical protein